MSNKRIPKSREDLGFKNIDEILQATRMMDDYTDELVEKVMNLKEAYDFDIYDETPLIHARVAELNLVNQIANISLKINLAEVVSMLTIMREDLERLERKVDVVIVRTGENA